MSRRLHLEEVEFRNIFEEISVLFFGYEWEDDKGNYYWHSLSNTEELEEVDRIFHSGGGDDYLYMEHIFKYKDKFFSCVKNENSHGSSGWETDTLKEVFPKTIEKVIYE